MSEHQDSNRETTLTMFREFSHYLDNHNDRYEGLVKLSRDMTIQSKRAIFQLHRSVVPDRVISNDTDLRAHEIRAAKEAYGRLEVVRTLLNDIAAELNGEETGRYAPAISPGLQEYIEALSFAHYIEMGDLISYTQVASILPEIIPLSYKDYLLGVSDLTGELMRYAISSVSIPGGGKYKASQVCTFVRACAANFERLVPYVPGLSKKQTVTSESLKKIERAAYDVAIRGSEHPDPGSILVDFSRVREKDFDDDTEYY